MTESLDREAISITPLTTMIGQIGQTMQKVGVNEAGETTSEEALRLAQSRLKEAQENKKASTEEVQMSKEEFAKLCDEAVAYIQNLKASVCGTSQAADNGGKES